MLRRGTELLDALTSPILLAGDERTAFRDPAAVFHEGRFYLYYTLVTTEDSGRVYLRTAMSVSDDLRHFSRPEILTPRDERLNYSSPGNVIRHGGKWKMCLQTYPRPGGIQYADATARLWLMESDDLRHWSPPRLLRVKGPDVPVGEMGRMIDPYLVEDRLEPGKWWCFYKQNGVSRSWSHDLENWTFAGHAESGENVCVLTNETGYTLFHSPPNGIGVMHSPDLTHWENAPGLITLGQAGWPWAQGRLTAGFVLDCRAADGVGNYLMFFHGTGPEDEKTMFDTHACIGLAWSKDLRHWDWPGKTP